MAGVFRLSCFRIVVKRRKLFSFIWNIANDIAALEKANDGLLKDILG